MGEASICTDIQTFSFTSLVCDLLYPRVTLPPPFHPLPPPPPPLITNTVSNAFKHSHYFSLASCPHTRRRPVQSAGTEQGRGEPQTVGSHLLSQWEHLLECSIFKNIFFTLFQFLQCRTLKPEREAAVTRDWVQHLGRANCGAWSADPAVR